MGKMVGLGLAAAVLVDATVIRMSLVPAVMSLLGAAASWFPGRYRSPQQPNPTPETDRQNMVVAPDR